MGDFDTTVGESLVFLLPRPVPYSNFRCPPPWPISYVPSNVAYYVFLPTISLVNTYLYGLVTYQFLVYRYTSTSLLHNI